MALNTQVLFAAQFEVVLEIRSHGLMTTDTGHYLTCARVKDFLANRMCEFSLGLMATNATIVSSLLQHGEVI